MTPDILPAGPGSWEIDPKTGEQKLLERTMSREEFAAQQAAKTAAQAQDAAQALAAPIEEPTPPKAKK